MPSTPSPEVRLHRALTLAGRLCVFGLALTPLIYNPRAWLYGDAFFPPKWSWIGAMAVLGLASVLSRALIGAPLRFQFDATWIAALLYLILHPLSLLWSQSRSLAIERTLQIGVATLALIVTVQAVRTRRMLLRLAWTAIAVGTLTALWTLEQDFASVFWPERAGVVPNLPDWRGYLAAGLGNTNHIGDLLALALLAGLVLFGEARRRRAVIVLLAALTVLAAGLTVCWSVGSNLGLFAGAAMMLGLLAVRRRTRFFGRRKRWLALGCAWALMLGFFLTDHPANPHRPGLWKQAFGSERWHEGGSTRAVIWAGGLEIIRLHPWLGVGAGNFTYVYPEMRSAFLEDRPEMAAYEGHWTNAAHNELLQTWSELGLPGLMLLMLLVALAFHSLLADIAWANRRDFIVRMTLATLLAAVCAQSMMNFVLQHPSGLAGFYLLLAGAIAEKAMRRSSSGMPPLVVEKGWARLHMEWRSMERPTGVGLAFRPPKAIAIGAAVALWMLAIAALPLLYRPVRAESEYGLAASYRRQGNPAAEETHILRALALNPWATGCRSRYVEFLLEQNRPAEALAQLGRVRQRLNSRELWQREARALQALGRQEEAARAYQEYIQRLPRSPEPQPPAP